MLSQIDQCLANRHRGADYHARLAHLIPNRTGVINIGLSAYSATPLGIHACPNRAAAQRGWCARVLSCYIASFVPPHRNQKLSFPSRPLARLFPPYTSRCIHPSSPMASLGHILSSGSHLLLLSVASSPWSLCLSSTLQRQVISWFRLPLRIQT